MRFAYVLLLILTGSSSLVRAQVPPEIDAIDRQFQKAIGQADRSVVAIFVGRSDRYPAPDAKHPGTLGRYDAAGLLAKVPAADTAGKRLILDLDLAGPRHVPEAMATGVILDKSGLILTAAHAIARARKLYVKLPGGKGSYADIHALDPRSDLAMLKLIDPPEGLVAARLGDGGAVRKGQLVLLLDSPFVAGAEQTPTASWGMVTALRRRLPAPEETDRTRLTLHHHGTLLQIESRLNLPTSGGIVLNLRGEVVGLRTAHAAVLGSDVPGGFVIPFDQGIQRIISVLLKGEEVEYGFLGVGLQAAPFGRGAGVTRVSDGSPADRAGLPSGAVIVGVGGEPVNDLDDLFLLIGTRLAGSAVEIEYRERPGAVPRTVRVTLARYWVPMPSIATNHPDPVAGLRVDWSSLLNQRNVLLPWNRGPIQSGVLVSEVRPGSAAAATPLQIDDLITHVGRTPVTTPAEFYKAAAAVRGDLELTYVNSEGHVERVKLAR